MPASTARRLFLAALMQCLMLPGLAKAMQPSVCVEGSTELYRMGAVSTDLAQLASEELLRSGWYTQVESPNDARFLVEVRLLAIGSADKDGWLRIGNEWSDLEKKLGQGRRLDQVKLEVTITDSSDGTQLARTIVEGLESRDGTDIQSENPAYLTYLNASSDEFRRTSLGRAAYKALSDALDFIYDTLPLRGKVEALADDSVILDLDSNCGLEKGDDLVIQRDIPFTSTDGTPVWHEYRRVGLVRILDFQPGHCLCLILEGQGQLAEGDSAQPLLAPVWFPEEADQE